MKNIVLSLLAVTFVMLAACKKDETKDDGQFVSETSENRKVVLEEFTGVKCGFCPDGAIIAKAIVDNNPGQAISIGIHGGSYSTPYPGDPDLSTTWASALISFSGLTGFPAGMVNREDYDNNGALAMSRSLWTGDANTVLADIAVVNVGIKSSYNSSTRTASIIVELYYTGDGNGTNLLNVLITENGIITEQAGYGPGYEHAHVLRDLVTGQWGEDVTTTTSGTYLRKEYTYSVSSDWDASECEVIAFVTLGDKTKILNGEIIHSLTGTAN